MLLAFWFGGTVCRQGGLACGETSTRGGSGHETAAGHISEIRIRLMTWDKLYDLGGALPDVMGLRATQPRAAIVKVMTVPDSRCVRVIVPDDHLPNGFHEILIHDMEDEETPLVVLSELGFLSAGLAEGFIYVYGSVSV